MHPLKRNTDKTENFVWFPNIFFQYDFGKK